MILFNTGCFVTLQTGKIKPGPAFTVGYLTLPMENHKSSVILRPSIGLSAKKNRFGVEVAFPFYFEYEDWGNQKWCELWCISDEIKVQFPLNKWADVSVGADLLLYVPMSKFIIISKELNDVVSLYGEVRYITSPRLVESWKEVKKYTIGLQLDSFFSKYLSLLTELNWWNSPNPDYPFRKENSVNFALGIILHK